VPVTQQPYYVRQSQPWAIAQERQRHTQALLQVGENFLFTLMWHIQDFEAGLVVRCARCFSTGSTVDQAIANVYKQPNQNRCPDCYGTTFEGGIKAQIVRPAIISDADQTDAYDARGVTHVEDLTIESTADFHVRNGDYAFRANGDRFYLRVPTRTTLRTGYGSPSMTTTGIDYNLSRASLEDPSSVAYLLPPTLATQRTVLHRQGYGPSTFTDVEVIHAPLIPDFD
jgi:hypothetical protein